MLTFHERPFQLTLSSFAPVVKDSDRRSDDFSRRLQFTGEVEWLVFQSDLP